MTVLTNIKKEKGVYYVTEKNSEFSSVYIKVRDIENRVYTDAVVQKLPYIPKNHHYYTEWKLRQKSTQRIVTYLSKSGKPLKILDLGCGNGWFSHQLSLIPDSKIFAVDINDTELEQAARVFNKSNLQFIYADIFSSEIEFLGKFDVITINSCIQYFKDVEHLLKRLQNLLIPGGELHILDSPFYELDEVNNARQRTLAYYQKLGVPEMAKHYFHHSLHNLEKYQIMYQPKKTVIYKLLFQKDSPFMWLKFFK